MNLYGIVPRVLTRVIHDEEKRQKQKEPRRILTDFLIGAHAHERKFALLTLDNRIFKAAFPRLKIIIV